MEEQSVTEPGLPVAEAGLPEPAIPEAAPTEPAEAERAEAEPALNVPLAAALLVAVAAGFGFWGLTAGGSGAAPMLLGAGAAVTVPSGLTLDGYVDFSARMYREKKFPEAAEAALQAIRLKPDSAVAWNNRAAALADMGRWDEAIAAAQTAVRLKPDFELARNNLAWALAGKAGKK